MKYQLIHTHAVEQFWEARLALSAAATNILPYTHTSLGTQIVVNVVTIGMSGAHYSYHSERVRIAMI